MVHQNLCDKNTRRVAADNRNSLTRRKIKFIVNIFGNSHGFYAQCVEIVYRIGKRCDLIVFAYNKIAQKSVEIFTGNCNLCAVFFLTALTGKAISARSSGFDINSRPLLQSVTVFSYFGNDSARYASGNFRVVYRNIAVKKHFVKLG